MKIQRFAALLTALLLLCAAGCADSAPSPDSSTPPLSEMELPTESGTTTDENPYAFRDPGDNHLFIFHDGWVYFHENRSTALRRMRPDGSENSVLYESVSAVTNLQLCGDWLYFSRSVPSSKIVCRVRTDGTGFEELDHIYCFGNGRFFVADDRFYYSSEDVEQRIEGIYTIHADSTEAEVLISGPGSYGIDYLHPEGWIYYHVNSRENDDVFYWRIRPDGTGNEAVSPYLFTKGIWFGDWIYYVADDKQLYKMRTDGSEVTLLSERKIGSYPYVVTSQRIYASHFVIQGPTVTGALLSIDPD
ncbi:MAG: DUF5050 domain-containing protein [Clostridia bacterium]|nr:DUF5050 domain-containing protein [Clostridia bacterium]